MNLADAQCYFDEMESRLTAGVSERMLDLAGVREGTRVLDLASGRGEPALRAARRVGHTGHVLGVDLHDSLLVVARGRARDAGIANIELRVCDVENVDALGHDFDVATSRWGLMYMAHPERALAAVGRALRRGSKGVLVAGLWAEREQLTWWSLPREVIGRYLELPLVDAAGPSPFRLGTREQIEQYFTNAGLAVEHIEEMEVAVVEADTGTGIALWARAVMGRWLNGLPPEKLRDWETDFARAAEAYREGGMIRLGGVTRIVVARVL